MIVNIQSRYENGAILSQSDQKYSHIVTTHNQRITSLVC